MDKLKRKNILIVIFIITTIIASVLAVYFAIFNTYSNENNNVNEMPNINGENNKDLNDDNNNTTDDQNNEITQNVTDNKSDEIAQNTTKTYNLEDYVLITDFKINENYVGAKNKPIVKIIKFKNLPERSTYEFLYKQSEFTSPRNLDDSVLSNEIISEIDKNILSVYCKEKYGFVSGPAPYYEHYGLNINLDNNNIITNQELLEIYNINPSDMFEKILNNIANTIKIDFLFLTTNGDVSAEKITIDKFKENIKTYVTYINNRYDIFTLYIKNGKLNVAYDQNKVLNTIGMGSSGGVGLIWEPQSIQLN